jgi:hypothetical protein
MSDFLDYCKKNNIRLEGQKQYEEIIKWKKKELVLTK